MENPQDCGLYTSEMKLMPLKYFSIECKVVDSICSLSLCQAYINWNSQPLDLTYYLPTNPEIAVSDLTVEVDDQVIEAKVTNKQGGKQLFDYILTKGDMGVMVQEKQDEILKMEIGNILPEQQVNVKLKLILQAEVENGTYSLRIPTYYAPKKWEAKGGGEQRLGYRCRYLVDFQCTSDITYVSYPKGFQIANTGTRDMKKAQLVKEDADGLSLQDDLDFFYKTLNMQVPTLKIQTSPLYPNQAACMLSFVPSFDANMQKPQRFEQPQLKQTSTQEDPLLFIFLVDRSNSMAGAGIEMVKESLFILLKSLPLGCFFEVISFGTQFGVLSGGSYSFAYTEQNLQNTLKAIGSFTANLGMANMADPLEYILSSNYGSQLQSCLKKVLQKKVFIMSAGEVSNPARIIEVASQAPQLNTQIFSFGIGKRCNANLIKQIALHSKGCFSFIEDKFNLAAMAITFLEKSMSPMLSDCRISYNCKALISSSSCNLGQVFRNQNLNHIFVINSQDLNKLQLEFQSASDAVSNNPTKLKLASKGATVMADGEDLFKLAVKGAMNEARLNKECLNANQLAIAYQVLNSQTAMTGIIKQRNKPTLDKTKIKIPILTKQISSTKSKQLSNTREAAIQEQSSYLGLRNSLTKDVRQGVSAVQPQEISIQNLVLPQIGNGCFNNQNVVICQSFIGKYKGQNQHKKVNVSKIWGAGFHSVPKKQVTQEKSFLPCHHHALTLITHSERILKDRNYENGYTCDWCLRDYEVNASWSCLECGYDICSVCNKKHHNKTPMHYNHQHPLFYTSFQERLAKELGYKNGFQCDGCSISSLHSSWHCFECQFDLCYNCHVKYRVPGKKLEKVNRQIPFSHQTSLKRDPSQRSKDSKKQFRDRMPHQTTDIAKVYKDIIKYQSWEGCWNQEALSMIQSHIFVKLNENRFTSQLIGTQADKKKFQTVLPTIVAIRVLQVKYASQRSEWKLLEQKARGYLKSQGIELEEALKTLQIQFN